MSELLPFFLVLFAGLFFSEVFNRLHLPWVVALLVGGIIIGPHVLGIFTPSATLSFLGQIGLIFLMFMAGLETRLSRFKEGWRSVETLSLINGLLPFAIGFAIGYLFGFDIIASLLLGIIFISSSIAVVIPSLEASGILSTRLGSTIVSATIVEDVASLVFLSILFQSLNPVTNLPLPVFYAFLFLAIIALRWVIPKVRWFFSYRIRKERDLFQQELRSIFVVLIGTVIAFELLGLHPIIAGFFAGFVLSDSVNSKEMISKLRAISYGLFIPIFFVVIGATTDISVLNDMSSGVLILAVVGGSILSKFLSGWIGGRANGFSSQESTLIGVSTIPQLSTTLAVVFAAAEIGLLPGNLVTAMVFLSIITTFASPLLIKIFARRLQTLRVGSVS